MKDEAVFYQGRWKKHHRESPPEGDGSYRKSYQKANGKYCAIRLFPESRMTEGREISKNRVG